MPLKVGKNRVMTAWIGWIKNREPGFYWKTLLLLALWVLPLFVAYAIRPFFESGMPDGDVLLYHRYANQLMNGQLPYIDYHFEYPPASIFIFLLPALFTTMAMEYIVVYQVFSWVAMFGTVCLFAWIYPILGIQKISKYWLVVLMSIASILVMVLGVNRFDAYSSFFTVLGFALFIQGVDKNTIWYRALGVMVIVFATLVKLYPMFLLPFMGIYELKHWNWKAMFAEAGGSIALMIPFVAWMIPGWEGLQFFLGYHSDRGLEIESLWATLVLMGHQFFGWFDYTIIYEFGSISVRGDVPDLLSDASLIIYGGLLVVAAIAYWFKINQKNAIWMLMSAMVVINVGFAAFNKVFSTQYVVWFIPLILVYLGLVFEYRKVHRPWKWAMYSLVGIAISTVLIFPLMWGWYVDEAWWLTLILLTRNIALVGLFGYALLDLIPSRADVHNALKFLNELISSPKQKIGELLDKGSN